MRTGTNYPRALLKRGLTGCALAPSEEGLDPAKELVQVMEDEAGQALEIDRRGGVTYIRRTKTARIRPVSLSESVGFAKRCLTKGGGFSGNRWGMMAWLGRVEKAVARGEQKAG